MTETRSLPPRVALALALSLFAAVGARAQAAGAASAPAPSSTSAQAADRAQKEADRTLYWIRVLADKPAAKPAAASPTAPRAAPAAATARTPSADVARAAAPATTTPGRAAAAPTTSAAPANGAGVSATAGSNATVMASASPPPSATAAPAALPLGIDPTTSLPAESAAIAAPVLASPLPDVPALQAPEEPDAGLVLAESVDPKFPIPLMTRLRKGQVEVRFEVAPDGHVESASVERSTHHGLEAAALDAVRQWRFKPGSRGHTAVVDLAFDMDS